MTSASTPALARALGRYTLAALVVNAILGSGIFGLPSVVARLLGPLAPWAWVLGAVGNAVVLLCFAEVASRFSGAGGAYLYARSSLPRLVAIQVGWLAFLTRLTAAAAAANLFTVNLAGLAPWAAREDVRIALLTALLGFLALVNVRGVAEAGRLSNLFTVGKLLPLAVFLAAGALFLLTREALPAVPAPLRTASGADWLQAILLVVFAFGGYDGAMMAMGEARQPRRDAPFALIVGTVLLALIYTGVQVVVGATLADPAASERPLQDAARVFLGAPGGVLLALGAIISVVGLLAANFLNAPRLGFALAEHLDLPPLFGRIHPRFHTPYVSILTFGFLVWGLAVWGNFEWNATLSSVSRLFVYGSTCVALVMLRRRQPGGAWLELPGGPVLAALGIAFCALLAARMGRSELVIVGLAAVVAFAHWLIARRLAAG
ncbi:MAG TPA: amino acid permease [Thermoanaerobaculia bacterium]|nr:amino acid permease [Thermoanaerobaculia bacterium]